MIPTIFTQKDFQDNQGEFCNPAVAHELANMKFKEWVKTQPEVAGVEVITDGKKTGRCAWANIATPEYATHKARLVCVEEIK